MSEPKALVTGGAGFIGSNLAIDLEAGGYEVKVIDDFSNGAPANLRRFEGEIVAGDILRLNSLLPRWRPEVIFHQAALTDTTVMDRDRMMGADLA